jgi:hypothetical protein
MRLYQVIALISLVADVWAFLSPHSNVNTRPHSLLLAAIDEAELKAELTEYLKKREEANADEIAKA